MSNNDPSHNGGRSTGPRSPEGKAISKQNATTHGIFSHVAVLKEESRDDYEALLDGLRQSCQPVGSLEAVLVEKLATILWRHRRLLLAEVGEIRQNLLSFDSVPLPDSPGKKQRQRLADDSLRAGMGLLNASRDAQSLINILEVLKDFRGQFRKKGFQEEQDKRKLKEIYGTPDVTDIRGADIIYQYNYLLGKSKAAAERSDGENRPPIEASKEKMLQVLEEEIQRIHTLVEKLEAHQAQAMELKKLSGTIPWEPGMERILRYEASLERAFDRALVQLERLQRMRLGQPVAPPIKVELTH
jgi:hypothetical protein